MATTDAAPPVSPLVVKLHAEGLIGAAAAAKVVAGPENRTMHPTTIARWHQRGTRLRDGRSVRLEAIHVGGRLLTSRAAILRYLSAQQDADTAVTPQPRSPSERQAASEAAARQLELAAC